MKIAYITPYFLPSIGGIVQHVYELAKTLIRDGFEVEVHACRFDMFKMVCKEFFPNNEPVCVKSRAASTIDFVRNLLLLNKEKLREIIYINANPVVEFNSMMN